MTQQQFFYEVIDRLYQLNKAVLEMNHSIKEMKQSMLNQHWDQQNKDAEIAYKQSKEGDK